MASLSSTTRMRCVSRSDSIGMDRLRRCQWQRQGEGGTFARTGAFGPQRTAQLLGRKRCAVESETVPVRARGKAVIENPVEVFLWNAHPGIDDRDHYGAACRAGADGHALRAAGRFGAGVL